MRRATSSPRQRIVVRPPELPAAGVFRRAAARVRRPVLSVVRRARLRWLLRRGVTPARRWRPPLFSSVLMVVTWVLAAGLLFWLGRAVYEIVRGEAQAWPWGVDPDSACRSTGYSCGVVNSAVLPVLTAALTTVVFLSVWMTSVRRYYLRRARHEPRALVETAGSIMGRVVGRDQLCIALMDNLRDSSARRPHVVVGAIGTGKTALVVRLTELLARRGAFPVPIRLRDAQQELDFAAMAYRRFCAVVEPRTRTAAEADKIWRRLRRQDKVVVLADGLEEALSGKRMVADRDNMIRQAIRAAGERRLPLVITSRPHDPLRAMEAAVTELEPLSEESALEYISTDGDWRADKRRLDRIVEIANVTDSPLYLQIARDLHRKGLLDQVWVGDNGSSAELDSWELKFDLLTAWTDALVDDVLHPELPLDRDDRQMTVEYMSALACIGLKFDSAQVSFSRIEPQQASADADGGESGKAVAEPFPHVSERLWVEKGRGATSLDVRLAATWGTRMGLVEECGDYVRFQHSIMQAFLGSRFLDTALPDTAFFPAALRNPGREILMALVFHSRSLHEAARCTCPRAAGTDPACPIGAMRRLVVGEAKAALALDTGEHRPVGIEVRSMHSKVLEMYGAALDIDSADRHPDPAAITREICAGWAKLRERDPQQLKAAKLALVLRIGAASRRATLCGGHPAYRELFEIGRQENSYRIRTAIAQEIGAGGDPAYGALCEELRRPTDTLTASGPAALAGAGPVASPSSPEPDGERERRQQERALRVRQEKCEQDLEREESTAEQREWYRNTICARLIPLLVDSVSLTRHQGTPYEDLEKWMKILGTAPAGGEEQDRLGRQGLEVALAHGFKHAANRLPLPGARGQAREFLAEQAWELLKSTRFWFTRLTLLHALTLWALPDDVTQAQPEHGHGADPKEQVRRWLQLPPGEVDHPFVSAAGRLAVRALQTRRPERFLWLDEARVASQVGSETGWLGEPREHNLWISHSTGWSTLDPDAQQLLADVTLLMVLAERADRPRELFRRLDRDRDNVPPELPPCLTRDRSSLDPTRRITQALSSQPGSNCADGCRFELCPHPPKIPDLRVELGEVFCMNQRSLLRRWQPYSWLQLRFRRKARWQRRTPIAELRRFWDQMGSRARDMPPESAPLARHLLRW